MNLDQLIAAGSISPIKYVTKEVEWNGNKFDVKVKSESTPADFEFIYSAKESEDSYMARRIHRYILLEDDKQIPYEAAKNLQESLLMVLASVINQVHEKKDAPQKKISRRKKNSGMN